MTSVTSFRTSARRSAFQGRTRKASGRALRISSSGYGMRYSAPRGRAVGPGDRWWALAIGGRFGRGSRADLVHYVHNVQDPLHGRLRPMKPGVDKTSFFAERTEVVAAYLFGSAARGEVGPLADVDVAVLIDEGVAAPPGVEGRSRLVSLQIDLAGQLPALAGGRRVDVVILNTAPVHIAFPAVTEGILLQGLESRQRVLFEVDLLRRHTDYRPVLEKYGHALARRIEEGRFLGS